MLWSTLLILLLISAFFSGSETGMMSLNRYRLRHQRKKSSGARRAAKLLATPDRLIGLILIGNNAANILAAIIANMLAILYVGEAAAPWVATATLTILMLVFSEVTPKTIAAQNPEWFAFKASHILKPLMMIIWPLVWAVNKLTNGLIKLLGFDPNASHDDGLDTEELRSVVDVSGHKISDSHQGMLKGILDLENVTVEDIMIPRNEINGLDLKDDIDTLMATMLKTEYTRLPLYEGDINNIVGIFHIRKANHLLRSEHVTHNAIKRFSEEPYFIPDSTTLTNQLLNFKTTRNRFAVVVDEYGEVKGLVTLEDILEEIVGEIADEFDDGVEAFTWISEGKARAKATLHIEDLADELGIEISEEDFEDVDTIGGLMAQKLGRVPIAGSTITVGQYLITSERPVGRRRRISSVLIEKESAGDDNL